MIVDDAPGLMLFVADIYDRYPVELRLFDLVYWMIAYFK